MTDSDQALLHVTILQALKAAGDLGRPEDRMLNDVRLAGFDLTAPALQSELRTLGDKNWITPFSPAIGPKRHRITELGKSKLVEVGL
jgi:hypothetical protein